MALLLVHAGATLAMVGLIWFVQLVHYPLFEFASSRRFVEFAAEHQRRTALVVAPLMLVEMGSGVFLLLAPPSGVNRALPWAGALLLALIWASTALLQVPLHRRLSEGHDAGSLRRLVTSNWLRTGAWSLRGVLALVLIARSAP